MAYFEDLSVYTYFGHTGNKTKNVGWLDRSHQFPQATPTDDLLDLIREHCKKPAVQTFGIHHCEWCPAGTEPQVDRVGCRVLLGGAEIRVFSEDGMIYAAPNLIYHYVSVHHYKPPDEFIRALNNAPRPRSPEYAERLREWEHGWDLTFVRDFSDCCRKAHEMSMPGYSGTPLTKKLGIKDGFRVALLHVPDDVKTELRDALAKCRIQPFTSKDIDLDFIFLFAKSRAGLELELRSAAKALASAGMLWISWPKKSSGLATDITEDAVRQAGLDAGLVDIKVCAVTEVWSGLKFVIPVKNRPEENRRSI